MAACRVRRTARGQRVPCSVCGGARRRIKSGHRQRALKRTQFLLGRARTARPVGVLAIPRWNRVQHILVDSLGVRPEGLDRHEACPVDLSRMILDSVRAPLAVCTGVAAVVVLTACAGQAPAPGRAPSTASASASGRIQAAATISTLAALVKAVGGDRVDVFSIVPVGVSPETYDPAPRDLVAISHAQL